MSKIMERQFGCRTCRHHEDGYCDKHIILYYSPDEDGDEDQIGLSAFEFYKDVAKSPCKCFKKREAE